MKLQTAVLGATSQSPVVLETAYDYFSSQSSRNPRAIYDWDRKRLTKDDTENISPGCMACFLIASFDFPKLTMILNSISVLSTILSLSLGMGQLSVWHYSVFKSAKKEWSTTRTKSI